MRAKARWCLAALLGLLGAGCGTVVNCTAGRAIYGGVKQDMQNGAIHLSEAFTGPCPSLSPLPENPSPGKRLLTRSFCAGCGVSMLALDLPISAVADTLTLPVTIPASLLKGTADDKRSHRPARKPAAQSGMARNISPGS